MAPEANGTDVYGAANNLNQYPSVTLAGQSQQTIGYDTRGNWTGDGVWFRLALRFARWPE
jgi:hypothetical protein